MKSLITMFLLIFIPVMSQEYKPINGVKDSKPKYIALTNLTIVCNSKKTIENGTILIQDEKIVKVGKDVSIPKEALIINYENKVVLPAFIELNSSLGITNQKRNRDSYYPQLESSKNGAYYWNEAIHPEVDASTLYSIDEKAIDDYLKMGFGFVSTHQQDGIIRGSSALFSLGKNNLNKQLQKKQVATFFSFDKGSSNQNYPSSQMGSIALIRQALYDLDWYSKNKQKHSNLSLDALETSLKGNLFFESKEKYEILRNEKIAKEFNLNFNYIGSGNEYEIIDDLKDVKSTFVLPLNFPSPYDVRDPYVSKNIPLGDLKHWEIAPSNPSILAKHNLSIALSSKGLSPSDFWKNLRTAIQFGLSTDKALDALTIVPASSLGVSNEFGSIEEGKKASFTIYETNPFDKDTKLIESWLLGEQNIHTFPQDIDMRGKYNLAVNKQYFQLEISGTIEKPTAKIKHLSVAKIDNSQKKKKVKTKNEQLTKTDTLEVKAYLNISQNDLNLQFTIPGDELKGLISLHAKFNSKFAVLEGDGTLADGSWVKWSAIRNETPEISKSKNEDNKHENLSSIWYPNMAYGFDKKPNSETIVIENVTLWTNEKDGIISNGMIVLDKGKISYVGKNNGNRPTNARIIDGKGKHVSPGIIDEHSHIAISRGVNEGSQAITSEVSIADVVKADDIEIYRQLSGGVTAAQLLHGSANPIGGQSALIKLKWGHPPSEMLIPNAPKFIKFALGENVKQSNWGEQNSIRFPQTRMGVEQLMYDAFTRAKKYNEDKTKNASDFHTDLELEVLAEILRKERFITCHSYVQSEINMLMHVADSFGFTLNTFTHILEGYKLADKMKKHGAGASTFADWWAYKYEVLDAIPYNASLMTEMGVTTAINSDDAEMGRRLNQEAAKAIKYGGMSEEDALKMVTLNPAKLLHLDQRMGSLKIGKDADIVLWSDNPLSIEAKALMTIIDGEILYDSEKKIELENRNSKEKARIIAKMINEIENGTKPSTYNKKKGGHFHCNTIGEESTFEENQH
jgi:imidazolonepropionase-like amidohydrolase